jgi:SAM-dependent methyltransferase
LGCGSNPYKIYQPPQVAEWIGFDVPGNPEAEIHGYGDALPFVEESFDTVLCTEVLEHVADPGAVVREMARVLKPGGYVITTTPLYFPIHEAPYDFFRYTPYGLRYLFERAGFKIVELRSMATGSRLVSVAINTCINNRGKRLPGGTTWLGRAIFAPLYLISNIIGVLLSGAIADETNAVGIALVALKPDR